MLVGLIRSPAQLQKVANISLSTHEHFPTAALGEEAVPPAPKDAEEEKEPPQQKEEAS
jgi:hypothetical protein